jgi:single-strand DNA-binding protein
MNLVVIKGNLVRDPEIRDVNVGGRTTKVVNFTVAVSRFFKKANGDRDKDTTFIPCEAWDTGAERIGLILKKGDPVLVEGSLKTESWEKDGQKHSRMKVRVANFDKLNRSTNPNAAAEDNSGTEEVTEEPVTAGTTNTSGAKNTEEDIPF